jgi:hypothetical protein
VLELKNTQAGKPTIRDNTWQIVDEGNGNYTLWLGNEVGPIVFKPGKVQYRSTIAREIAKLFERAGKNA